MQINSAQDYLTNYKRAVVAKSLAVAPTPQKRKFNSLNTMVVANQADQFVRFIVPLQGVNQVGATFSSRCCTTPNTSVVGPTYSYFLIGGSGGNGVLYYSADAINWYRSSSAADFMTAVNALLFSSYSGGRWYAGGSNSSGAILLTSTNGVTWGPISGAAGFTTSVTALTRYVSTIYAAGLNSSTVRVASSPDGVTWTGFTNAPGGTRVNRLATNGTSLVAAVTVASGIGVYYTTDLTGGTAWSPSTWTGKTNLSGNALVYASAWSLYVVGASDGTLGSASNLSTPTFGTGATMGAAVQSIALGGISPIAPIAVALASGATNNVAYSTNGTSWTVISLSALTGNTHGSVSWSDLIGQFVITADNGVVLTSTNGASWTSNVSTPTLIGGDAALSSAGNSVLYS